MFNLYSMNYKLNVGTKSKYTCHFQLPGYRKYSHNMKCWLKKHIVVLSLDLFFRKSDTCCDVKEMLQYTRGTHMKAVNWFVFILSFFGISLYFQPFILWYILNNAVLDHELVVSGFSLYLQSKCLRHFSSVQMNK